MREQRDEPERRPRLNLTPSQVAASGLAASCASIVASYLGVAGTVIGAAVGSVIATTGAAVYAQIFRRGGARIRQTLLVNSRSEEESTAQNLAAQDLAAQDPANDDHAAGGAHGASAAVPRESARQGRFYGAGSEGTPQAETHLIGPGGGMTAKFWLPPSSTAGQTRVAVGDPTVLANFARHAADADEENPVRPRRSGAVTTIRRYRKPIGVAVSIVAVFCVSITVGFLLGGPVRSAGSSSTPPASTNAHTQDTRGAGGERFSGPNRPDSPPATASATPSTSPSPSADETPSATPSASQPAGAGAGAGATGTKTGSAAGTAGTTGTPGRQPGATRS